MTFTCGSSEYSSVESVPLCHVEFLHLAGMSQNCPGKSLIGILWTLSHTNLKGCPKTVMVCLLWDPSDITSPQLVQGCPRTVLGRPLFDLLNMKSPHPAWCEVAGRIQ